jgi:glycosyltransferase involved in cell wall biosynthesis
VRILHVITTIERGGAENQLLILVREQIRQNFQVEVVYLKGENELENDFKALGAHVRAASPSKSLTRQFIALRGQTRDASSVVHAHLPRAELLVALSKPKATFVLSRHNAEPFFPGAPGWISKLLSRFISMRAAKVIAITQTVKNFLTESGEISINKPISVVHYGYPQDVDFNSKKKVTGKIGTLSRLVPQKDLPTLLRAFEIVLREQKHVVLEIYGEGPERQNLGQLTQELGIQSSVRFLGRTDHVNDVMRDFDIFVLTSRYEGFGLVLLEAMSNKVPIISSNSAAAVEVLGEEFQLFFQIGDFESLGKLILKVLSSRTERYLDYQSQRLLEFKPDKMELEIRSVYFD